MARGAFSLWELVRRADFENSARWCVVSELGAIRFPVVWGDSRGFVPINRGPGRQRGSLDRASRGEEPGDDNLLGEGSPAT